MIVLTSFRKDQFLSATLKLEDVVPNVFSLESVFEKTSGKEIESVAKLLF